MSDAAEFDPTVPHRPRAIRWLILLGLLAIVSIGLYVLFATPSGARLRQDPHQVGREFRAWVEGHGVFAPVMFVGLYVVVSLCLMPVWWLQVLAGYGFGLAWGIGFGMTGAVIGSVFGFLASRTLAADWVREKFEARHAGLRKLDEKLGHNGLAVVMAVRLTHVIPFGASNYLFGLTRINLAEVASGTLLGNVPAIAFYVAIGAGARPEKSWRFMAVIAAVNLILLVPVALRYWRPGWFRRIGVE